MKSMFSIPIFLCISYTIADVWFGVIKKKKKMVARDLVMRHLVR